MIYSRVVWSMSRLCCFSPFMIFRICILINIFTCIFICILLLLCFFLYANNIIVGGVILWWSHIKESLPCLCGDFDLDLILSYKRFHSSRALWNFRWNLVKRKWTLFSVCWGCLAFHLRGFITIWGLETVRVRCGSNYLNGTGDQSKSPSNDLPVWLSSLHSGGL